MFIDIEELQGIGEKYRTLLHKKGIQNVFDLSLLIPKYIEYTERIHFGLVGQLLTTQILITRINRLKKLTIIEGINGVMKLKLFFFHNKGLPKVDTKIYIRGSLLYKNNVYCMEQPKWSINELSPLHYDIGIPSKTMHKLIKQALSKIPVFTEWLPVEVLQEMQWIGFKSSLEKIHDIQVIDRQKYVERLAFDEALAYHIRLHNATKSLDDSGERFIADVDHIIQRFEYALTPTQSQAWNEITDDLQSSKKMIRFLYGDVGSGKTSIALLACAKAYDSGYSSCIVAPTQILANQHFITFQRYLYDYSVVLLTSATKTKDLLKQLNSTKMIIVATHAVLQKNVEIYNLGLIIFDEQHKFGVLQRLNQQATNVLIMSATPIPRTLQLTCIGALPISRILDRPHHVSTPVVKLVSQSELSDVIIWLKSTNQYAFWVCPYIDTEKANIDLQRRFVTLQNTFHEDVQFIHGRMKQTDRDSVINDFMAKKFHILLSTTIIEVGINIVHANIIIIENATNFGLAQLYQLMGRVGRSNERGLCIAIHDDNISKEAYERLQAFQNAKSGLELAEYDLQIRGAGNVLSTLQSGRTSFKLLNNHFYLLSKARDFVANDIAISEYDILLKIFIQTIDEPWNAG